MKVMGVLVCEILELEFARLFAEDPKIARITVIEDQFSRRLIDTLEGSAAAPVRAIPHIRGFSADPGEGMEILVQVLELALHRRKKILQDAIAAAAREMSRYVDALFLGYGLCGNALEDPKALLDVRVPVSIPMDGDHPVDDCVGLFIGGRDAYYEQQCKIAGTFFMIPGWTRHWRVIFEAEFGSMDIDIARRLFRHYERSLLVETPVMGRREMERNIEEFNQLFGLRTESKRGSMEMLTGAWEEAKGGMTD